MPSLSMNRRGFALEATLILMVLMAALAAAAVMGAAMVTRSSGVDYRATRVNYAAEAGADAVMAQLENAMVDGIISGAELAALSPPSLTGFTLTTAASPVGGAVPRTITNGPFAGLIGLNQQIDIRVSAVDATRNRSDAVVSVNAQSIPLFQFGVFYEKDLEIHNGPRMDFAGWVHTNGNLYLCSSNTYFQDIVTTPQSVFRNRKSISASCPGVFIDDADGVARALNFDSRTQPTDAGFTNASNALVDGRLMTRAMGVTPLRLPLPTGMPPIALIQPRVAGDPLDVQNVKMAWKSDYYITVDLSRLTNSTLSICAAGAMTVLPAARQVPAGTTAGTDCANIFQWRRNAFVEGREDIGTDVLDIDVSRLHTWIAGAASRANSIMYITFVRSGLAAECPSATHTNCDYPVVRLRNATTLRVPWTFATDRPVYVYGNYNTVGWQPSSILGDAITFLSNGWTDGAHAAYAVTNTTAEMWVYAAVAAGHSATPCDLVVPVAGCVPSNPPPNAAHAGEGLNYGGGLENFPRFLESWGHQMHYRGSLVSLFEAFYANRYRWSWRGYYGAPQRDWQFELRFRDPNQLPPGTPTAGTVNQIAFRPVY
jgi:hypothetical protein